VLLQVSFNPKLMEEPCRRVIGVSCDIIGPRRNRIFALFLDTILAIDGCM